VLWDRDFLTSYTELLCSGAASDFVTLTCTLTGTLGLFHLVSLVLKTPVRRVVGYKIRSIQIENRNTNYRRTAEVQTRVTPKNCVLFSFFEDLLLVSLLVSVVQHVSDERFGSCSDPGT
jgi:hypothetical protein